MVLYLLCSAGVGVKKALGLVRKYQSLARVLQVLRLNPKMAVPAGYPEAAQKALWNFRHALVYDAAAGTTLPLPLCSGALIVTHLHAKPKGCMEGAIV